MEIGENLASVLFAVIFGAMLLGLAWILGRK